MNQKNHPTMNRIKHKSRLLLHYFFLFLIASNFLFGQKIFETFDLERKHRYTGTTHYEFDINTAKPLRLVIDHIQGDIFINGTNSMSITIEEKITIRSRSRNTAEEKFEQYRAGIVHHRNRNTVEVTGAGQWPSRMNYSYHLSVPSNISILAHTSGGDIDVSIITGEMDLKTSGGDIDLEYLEGKLTGNTSGGDIRLDHGIGNIYLSTSGGDVDINDVEGKLNLHTSGGNIEIKNSRGNVNSTTSGGNIYLRSISGNRIEGRTSGGNIHANEITGKLVIVTSGGDLTMEDIRGSVRGNTSGGDIDIDNVTGNVDVTTSGGSIHGERIQSGIFAKTSAGNIYIEKSRLRMGEDYSIDLKTSSGDIYLSVPDGISATIDALIQNGENHYAIDSEFPLTIIKKHNDVEAYGTIGDGEHSIKLRNAYGHITIERN